MTKLLLSLLLCGVATYVNAADAGALSPWEKAVEQSDTDALKKLWEENGKKIPTDQRLAVQASASLPEVLETLMYLASVSKPPCCMALLQEVEIAPHGKTWINALGAFAVAGRIDSCKTILNRGISPLGKVAGVVDGLAADLLDVLLENGGHAEISEIAAHVHKIKLSGGNDIADCLLHKAVLGKYTALQHLLKHNVCGVQDRINSASAAFDNLTPLLLLTRNSHVLGDQEAALRASLLLENYKADPNTKHERTGATPLHFVSNTQPLLMRVLKAYGADDTRRDNNGNTPKELLAKQERAAKDRAMELIEIFIRLEEEGKKNPGKPQ